jgi:hypothetical protein
MATLAVSSLTASVWPTSNVLFSEREFKSHTVASSYCPISVGLFHPSQKNNRKIDSFNRPDSESYLQSTLVSKLVTTIRVTILHLILAVLPPALEVAVGHNLPF